MGEDYPARINDHKSSARDCNLKMQQIRNVMSGKGEWNV